MRSLTPQSFPRDRGLSGRIFRKTDRFLSFRGARVFEHALLVLCVTGIVSVIMAGSFSPSGNQKRFWRDPERGRGACLTPAGESVSDFPVDLGV
jgi:hypothetical protein